MSSEGCRIRNRTAQPRIVLGPLGRTSREIERSAEEDGLGPINEEQWKVIQFVRAYYRDNGHVPAAVRIGRACGLSPRSLRNLFPQGAVRTVLQLIGLVQPLELSNPCPFQHLLAFPHEGQN